MDQDLDKYGGREFLRCDLPIVHRLAWGEVLTVMPYGGVVGGGNRDTLLRLVNAGYAEECTTKWHQKFRATPELYDLKDIEGARTLRVYPTIHYVREIQNQVRRDLDYVENWPIEDGDVYQFSSRRLTDLYVQRFCIANNLT